MKRSTGALRFGPWGATLLAVLAFIGALQRVSESANERISDSAIRSSADLLTRSFAGSLPDGSCARLLELSEQAAGLTGALALVEAGERPRAAAAAATGVRRLARRAGSIENGTELGRVLDNLADALQSYSAGNPAALASIQAASARNAILREIYTSCNTEENR